MTDFLADTPAVGRVVGPTCEPDADGLTEILDTRYCSTHELRTGGVDDGAVVYAFISGGGEAGGEDNRAFCALIHRP